MRSLPYSDLERGVASIAGIDPTNLLTHEKVLIAEYVTDAVKYCWDYYPWAEFTKTEERYFREVFEPNKQYLSGDEVYYLNSYYRARVDVQASTIDLSSGNWYEVGDRSSATQWTEKGCYYIGARVEYNGKFYICIAEPTDTIGAYGNQPCCFEINAIDPDDSTYFEEIENNVFNRFIAYEQPGKDVIGTTLSVTLEDPRYNDTKPLNWREDREGIYIDPEGNSFNSVYLRFRLEAPIYTHESTTDEVPKFLAPAIKAFAYKSWLIGDGQHEKAQLQDIYGLDLLLREVDRLDLQQDRAQPFTITKNPYRRVNARQSIQASETTGQISSLKESQVDIAFGITKQVLGIVLGLKSVTTADISMSVVAEGLKANVQTTIQSDIGISASANGKNAVKQSNVSMGTEVYTGSPFLGVGIGEVAGQKEFGSANVDITTGITVQVTGENPVKFGTLLPSSFGFVITASPTGINDVESETVNANLSLSVSAEAQKEVSRTVSNIPISMSVTSQGSASPAITGQVSMSFGITTSIDTIALGTSVNSMADFTSSTPLTFTGSKYAYKVNQNGKFHQYKHPTETYFPTSFIGLQFELEDQSNLFYRSYAGGSTARMRFLLRSDGANSTTALSGTVSVFKKNSTSGAFAKLFDYTLPHYSSYHVTFNTSPVGTNYIVDDSGTVTTWSRTSYQAQVTSDIIQISDDNSTGWLYAGTPYQTDPNATNENLIFHHLAQRGETYRYIFNVNLPVKIYSGLIGQSSDDTNHHPEFIRATSGVLVN